jgi:hypothetical protein
MKFLRRLAAACFVYSLFACNGLFANSLLPISRGQQIADADVIIRGTVSSLESFESPAGGIYTRATVKVETVFKGRAPARIRIVERGGVLANKGEANGASPNLRVGDDRLFFLSRRADGTLFARRGAPGARLINSASASEATTATQLLSDLQSLTSSAVLAGADVTDQSVGSTPSAAPTAAPAVMPSSSATNVLKGDDGISARFVLPDRGEGTPYYVDADYLPAGMTLTQALNAVKTAIAAWTNACSVRFYFAGLQSFGMASANINNDDGALRIQLHDHYNYIGSGTGSGDTLGEGGEYWTIYNTSAGWTTGGNVAGNDFHRSVNGYVVLAHTNTFMQNITNFTEVLCHEIGHTIGLNHSSQANPEPNPLLAQAIMFWLVHGNGRGATLNQFDTNVCRQVHPASNTPPYCYPRVIDAVTCPPPYVLTNAYVNTVQLRGYDLQNTALTLATNDAANDPVGYFSMSGSNINFNVTGYYSDPRVDPASTVYYEEIFARYSDGTNASPHVLVRTISHNPDQYAEGVPQDWRTEYFGSPSPNSGLKHHANEDADGDGFSNINEWLLGSNPTNKLSNLRLTMLSATNLQFPAKPYDIYELDTSSNLTTWTRAMNPIVPTNSTAVVTGFTNGASQQFFRLFRIP